MKVLVTGDWHLDKTTIGIRNPETDLDLRTEDFFKAVDFMIDTAIEQNVELFILNGDLFKGRTSTHQIQTLVAERFKRIAQNMQLIINLGNHDFTAKQLTYGIHTYSVFERFDIPNIKIIKQISHLSFDDLDIVFYPYYDLKRIKFDNNLQLIKFIEDQVNQFVLTKDAKLFIGHGTPQGTIISENSYFDLNLIEEPLLPHSMFECFDKVLFSHIHRGHAIDQKIFHIGSPERCDFAEADHQKGFVIFDSKIKQTDWIEINSRPMKSIKLDLSDISEFSDPTEQIIDSFSQSKDLDKMMLKLEVKCSEQTKTQIDNNKLSLALSKCFYFIPVVFDVIKIQKSRIKEVNEQITEADALEKVLQEKKDITEDQKKQILLRGIKLINGVE